MNMGIKGAALATVVSRMVSCVFVLWFLLGKDTKLRLRFRNMRLNKSIHSHQSTGAWRFPLFYDYLRRRYAHLF